MIRQELYIPKYDWLVHCYFAVDTYYVDEIAQQLYDIGCRGETLERAIQNMASNNLNTGLCYSNMERRESVVVIALTTTAAQFADSEVHELRHLTNNICQASGVDMDSEESCYLAGWLARRMHKAVRGLLCDHCRHKE